MRSHHPGLMPATPAGQWSLFLGIAFLLCFGAFWLMEAIDLNREPVPSFFSNPLLSIPLFLAGVTATLSAVFGLMAIIAKHERSVLVFLSVATGIAVFLFSMAEILLPH
ncbi:MAG TPA: hypothetical protein VF145_03495 [Chitinophagaceae bacterium]